MGWEQLRSIYESAAQELREEQTVPPTSCPNDGQPLKTAPNGGLYCEFDGWEYPRDWVPPT